MMTNMPGSYPCCVLMGEAALKTIDHVVRAVYDETGTEWGGLLWGRVFAHPQGGSVPVVVAATDGICEATRVSCNILPASWEAGRETLSALGITGLEVVGDFHSHPRMRVFLSAHADVPAYWSFGHIPHWLSMVVDPWHGDYGIFARRGEQELYRAPSSLASEEVLRILDLPVPARLSPRIPSAYLASAIHPSRGGNHDDPYHAHSIR